MRVAHVAWCPLLWDNSGVGVESSPVSGGVDLMPDSDSVWLEEWEMYVCRPWHEKAQIKNVASFTALRKSFRELQLYKPRSVLQTCARQSASKKPGPQKSVKENLRCHDQA
ncbi:hypothetical protein NDU88_001363 [Pleurodeles waltl]|uniref:Uncharacterized protein n=1 Tax=Pleurodeles waltl TaxID=8319 RepID=A0AAV7UU47_PLEWA|nr:hypothetical protein NDU88_001363 [Pleurodeles waltl]